MMIFPGQGSQQPGMGKFLFDNFSVAKNLFEEASDAINFDLKKLCFEGSESDLALTENTQPALLLVSTCTQKVLTTEFGVQISASAGHSIGEYASLVAGSVLPFATAIKAVRLRGQSMQSAVPVGQGGMVATMGLEPQQVIELCKYVETKSEIKPLSPANFNAPGQIVISGSQKAIEWMMKNVKAEDVWGENGPKRMKFIPLQVSAPFHCSMMKPAEDKMREFFSPIKFNDSAFPIIQNFTAQPVQSADQLKENLILQISGSVLWQQSMAKAKELGHSQMIEAGAGRVLTGLLKKIDGEYFKVYNTNSLEELKLISELGAQ